MQGVLDRLATGLPERPCVAEDEATLTGAAHAYAVPLAVLCCEALEGRLAVRGRLTMGAGFQALTVRREEILLFNGSLECVDTRGFVSGLGRTDRVAREQ